MFPLKGVLTLMPFFADVLGSTTVPISPDHPPHHKFQTKTRGEMVNISGVMTYVALPEGSYDKSVALLFLTDVFGLAADENLLLVDAFANKSFPTYAPDYLNGYPFPQNFSNGRLDTGDGVKRLAAIGYCFGGLYATLLAQNNSIEVVSMAHPSSLTVPDDFLKLKNSSKVPVQINSAGLDQAFTLALALEADGIMANGQYKPGYERKHFEGVVHGFAVSADPANATQVAAKEGAFNNALTWFTLHLTENSTSNSSTPGSNGSSSGVSIHVIGQLGAMILGLAAGATLF